MSTKLRSVVKLINMQGSGTVEFDDGRREPMVFTGTDVEFKEHDPTGGCQRCGHDRSGHGSWDYDGEDEYWVASACDECLCPDWKPFTPEQSFATRESGGDANA